MSNRARLGAIATVVLLFGAACSGTGGTAAPTVGGSTAPAASSAPAATSAAPATTVAAATTAAATSAPATTAAVDPNDLLAKIKAAGEIRVSTDPNYAPQSFLKPDGTFEGFDIDVATEIAKRLGVKVKFATPDFNLVQAGGWSGRWDISVGSVTVTEARKAHLDFTPPYYFTPAQMSASKKSGITTLEGLAGKTVCVGEATTYLDWLEGTLKLGDGSTPAPPPAGIKSTTLPTDANCAEAIQAGRSEFEGFLSSSTTIEDAIKKGIPIVKVGDPVFFEPLAVAVDKKGPPHAALNAELNRIITEMHSDGTLSALSKKWYNGLDLTVTK